MAKFTSTNEILNALELGAINLKNLNTSEITDKGLILTLNDGKFIRQFVVKAELLSSHTIYDDTIFVSK